MSPATEVRKGLSPPQAGSVGPAITEQPHLGEITQRFHKKTTGGNNSTATHVSDLDPNRINHFAGGVMALGSGVQSSAGRVRGGGGRGNRQDGSGVSEADANNSALASFRVLRTGT
jgi:hypothetical protein